MSGEKVSYVRIEEREARRLREMETHFRAVQRDLPDRLNQIRNTTAQEIARQNARLEQRWREFEQTADKLRSDLTAMERRNRQRLQEGLARARTEYTDLVAGEREERLQQAAQMKHEYTSLIEQERAEREQQVAELQSRVGRMEDKEATLQQMASAWLQDLRILQEEVAQLPHQRFAPGRMERLNGLIEQGALNLRNGASQAALVNAQDAYFNLVELRAEVLYKEQEFESQYLSALEGVRSLIEEVRAHRQGVVPGDGAENEDIEVDINFWSRDKLSQLTAQLGEIETRLESEKQALTVEQVQQLDAEASGLRQKLPEVIEAAKLTIINSQVCYNVAEIVTSVMEAQGYTVETGTYEGEDQRGAYAVKMRNLGGDEFVTIITPSQEQELAYSTQMNFYDRNQDEDMRHNLADAVYQGLGQMGLQATPPQTTLDVEQQNEEARDLEKFRQRKPETRQTPSR
jgi:hypothetical protein